MSISAETAGRILEVPVMEGARVSKGQILARIDAESILRNIEELENSLDLATTIFEKQQRLWNQKNRYRNPVFGSKKTERKDWRKTSLP
ncbi:biotin/lipoyl-binding protein [Algoriphagus boritolerans]|uniref:biotin/lipoyl-binding protein n=1 Tax=Algoriphagus boritolerans TaxID=308111 RepID=UPI002FCE6694